MIKEERKKHLTAALLLENEGVLINGNASFHGINSNMNPNKTPRLAFTVRWAHKDDLYLPGSPDKALYKIDFPNIRR